MRFLALVVVAALLCAALAQDEEERPLRGRGRPRTRLISRQRLADVIGDAVVEESGEDGRKRVLVRRPGSARRRVKVIRRPRPSARARAQEPTTTPAPEPTTTEPPVTTFSPALGSFAFTSAPAAFSTQPAFSRAPQSFSRAPQSFSRAPEPVSALPEPVFLQQPAEPERPARQRQVASRRPAAPAVAAPTSAPRRQRPAEAVSSSNARQLNRKEEVVGTIRNYSYYNDDGSYTFGYEAEDGSFKEETRGVDCVVRGKYGYIDPDGVKREFTYESGNPCDETATEEAQFDEQGFPILDDEGGLVSGFDPLDDQPIRRPNTQFISQTKEEQLEEEELKQFRQPARRRRPESSRRRPTAAPTSAPEPIEAPEFTRRPEPVTFRPQPTFSFQPEPEREQDREPERQPERPFLPAPRPPVTFRPAPRPPVTFRPAIRVEPERRPQPTQPAFTSPQPRPFTLQPRPTVGGAFNFDDALSEIQSRPTTAPALLPSRPLDDGDDDFALSRPKGAVSGNFDHTLVFDPTTGKHRTDLVQTLPEGTEIRIGEHLNSFGPGPTTTTTPRPTSPPFQNSVFQSFSRPTSAATRPPPPPPTRPTQPPPPPAARPAFPPPPSNRPFTAFSQQPQQFRPPQQQPQPFRPPQQPAQQTRQPFSLFNSQSRPQQQQQPQRPVFSVFNQPRPQLGQSGQPQPRPTFIGRQARQLGQPRPQPGQPQPRPTFLGPQPRPQPTLATPQQQQASGPATSASSARPVQQVSFGTQVANPVFSRSGVPQPFGQFGGSAPPPQQQNQFRPPTPFNFFGQGQQG